MPPPRIAPWISKEDYAAFKKLAPSDPDLPPTYDEWLEIATEQASAFTKSGVPVDRVFIHPKDFEQYCIASGINPDGVARGAFAVNKAHKLKG